MLDGLEEDALADLRAGYLIIFLARAKRRVAAPVALEEDVLSEIKRHAAEPARDGVHAGGLVDAGVGWGAGVDEREEGEGVEPEVGAVGGGVGVDVGVGGEFAVGLALEVAFEGVHLGAAGVGVGPEFSWGGGGF